MNQFTLAGRIAEMPVLFEDDDGFKKAKIWLETGQLNDDANKSELDEVFPVVLWRGIAEEIAAKSSIGDCLLVQGMIEIRAEKESGEAESSKTFRFTAQSVEFLI